METRKKIYGMSKMCLSFTDPYECLQILVSCTSYIWTPASYSQTLAIDCTSWRSTRTRKKKLCMLWKGILESIHNVVFPKLSSKQYFPEDCRLRNRSGSSNHSQRPLVPLNKIPCLLRWGDIRCFCSACRLMTRVVIWAVLVTLI